MLKNEVEEVTIDIKDRATLDRYAKFVVDKGFGTVTILFLDSFENLNFVGSQFLHFFNPLLTMIPYFKFLEKIAYLLEERKNVDYFLNKIEHYMNEQDKNKPKNKND